MVGQKRSVASPDWVITFEDATSLRLIVEAVSNVMTRVTFKIKKKGDNLFFLHVDGADVGLTCCVSARLQLDHVEWHVDENEGDNVEFDFCVECKHVLTAIAPSSTGGSLKLQGCSQNATVTVTLQDPEQASHQDVSELSTFVDSDTNFSLSPLKFDTLLEMDLSKLREIIKKGRQCHAEILRISVFVNDKGSKKYSLVIFTVKGDNQKHRQKFCHEISHHEDGSMIVRAAADGETDMFDTLMATPLFDHGFPLDKLESFIKNLPTRMMLAKIKSGLPIMLSHNLKGVNDQTQHIRFLVASTNEDVEE